MREAAHTYLLVRGTMEAEQRWSFYRFGFVIYTLMGNNKTTKPIDSRFWRNRTFEEEKENRKHRKLAAACTLLIRVEGEREEEIRR